MESLFSDIIAYKPLPLHILQLPHIIPETYICIHIYKKSIKNFDFRDPSTQVRSIYVESLYLYFVIVFDVCVIFFVFTALDVPVCPAKLDYDAFY